ncbi:DUF3037 domain-containing protein [Pontibacter diazotrophicus]|uniref:DUF3037 domain-containing protein n=1 Tax=Pontibacter diazotrophicus TaxID=1400979 RepID=A0A3D8LGK9_9BACT|nr:DUF3037 domain-containing protein [Pontibacter diazotrophicus]RDV16042.1 DUF3037 domain-containing protein [Pontibacter diazotrophicus]
MQEKHLFEYAVIRVVPCVEREEFMNVGVIVYCASQGFLQTMYKLNENRLRAFSPNLDMQELQERLRAFERICAGRREGGAIGQLPIASRFRWLAATRSTIVQTSPVHPGLCIAPQETLARLYAQLVG